MLTLANKMILASPSFSVNKSIVTITDSATTDEFAKGCVKLPSGDLVIGGYAVSSSSHQGLLLRVSANGTIAWQRNLSYTTNGFFIYRIALSPEGDIYALGKGDDDGDTYRSVALLKFNASGVLQWQRKTVDSAADLNIRGLAIDSNNNIYFTVSIGGSDHRLIKYNSSGVVQFQRKITGVNATNITIDSSDNIYTSGVAFPYAVFRKYNSSGTLQSEWKPSDMVTITGITVDSSGNIYMVGYNSPDLNMKIIKLNSSETVLWSKEIEENLSPRSIYLSDDESEIVITTQNHVLVIDSSGDMVYQRLLEPTDTSRAYLEDFTIDGASLNGCGTFGGTFGGTAADDMGAVFFTSPPSVGDWGWITCSESSFTIISDTQTTTATSLTDVSDAVTEGVGTVVDTEASLTATAYSLS